MSDQPEPRVSPVECVEFETRLGNRLVCPSCYSVEDEGDVVSLHSPDDQVAINVLTYLKGALGTWEDFEAEILGMMTSTETWNLPEWSEVEFAEGRIARKVSLDPAGENPIDSPSSCWRAYLLEEGECYHAIVVNASTLAMLVNERAYEQFVRSFRPTPRPLYFRDRIPDCPAIDSLAENLEQLHSWMAQVLNRFGYPADYSLESLREADRFIEYHCIEGQPHPDGFFGADWPTRLFATGAYVGECIRRHLGGTWHAHPRMDDPEECVRLELTNGDFTWPVQQVHRRIVSAARQGLYEYARSLSENGQM